MNKREFINWLDGLKDASDVLGGSINTETLIQIIKEKAEQINEKNNIFPFPKLPRLIEEDFFQPGKFYKDVKTWINGELVEDIKQVGKLVDPDKWEVKSDKDKPENFTVEKK